MKNPLTWFIEALKDPLPQPMREAYSAAGKMIDNDDADWRPLSGDALRDLLPMNQRRMQDIAAYLWESNTLANRLIELPIAYILADGVKLKADDEIIQKLLNDFWNHPVNLMAIKLVKKVRELSMYGEQCYPTFVNQYSGAVRLGYLDPCLIGTVVVDPDNAEQPIGIITVLTKKGVSKRYKIIVNGAEEEMFTQRTIEIRDTFTDGDCFYFKINDLASGRRGRSDLLSQFDWLDSYDQFLFGELDRIQFLRAFMWDVTLTGANQDEVDKKAKSIRPPKPGAVRVHNEAETWKAESPRIESADTDTSAALFRNHVLGGSTIPEHWFGGGGDVNRSTGESMGDPTFKVMSLRQAYIGYMLAEMGRYVIRQWEMAHTGKEPDLTEDVYDFVVQFPEMVAKDTTRYAAALQQVTQAVSLAVADKLLTVKTGIQVIESIAGQLGVKFDAEKELAAIGEQPETVQTTGQGLDSKGTNQGLDSIGSNNGRSSNLGLNAKPRKMTEAVKAAPVFTADQQIIEDGVADVLSRVESPIDPEIIIEALKGARDFDDLTDRLAVLLGSDSSEFEQYLSEAMAKADVLGFVHASD
jgi:hypothetical protein